MMVVVFVFIKTEFLFKSGLFQLKDIPDKIDK